MTAFYFQSKTETQTMNEIVGAILYGRPKFGMNANGVTVQSGQPQGIAPTKPKRK
jgi:hypothetical protein